MIYRMVGSDLSDHAPAPWVKKNASRHRTDILTESWVFAGLPQVSRETFWRLRESRKRFGKCRGACAACANVSVNAGIPARPAQTSRQMPGAPRGLRKRLGKCREPRAACANVSANAGSPAQPAQTSRQMPGAPRGLRKRLGMGRKIIPNGHLGHIIPRRLR